MIYVSSSCIKRDRIAEVVQDLVQVGIRNIELSGGTQYYQKIVQDLVVLKQRYHLCYACHAYFPPPKSSFVINLASCNDQIYRKSVNHYIQCIKMLKYIGCKTLSVHAGFLIEIGVEEIGRKLSDRVVYDEERAYDRFCSAYEFIAKLCERNNITLFLENNVISAENYNEFCYHNYMMMTDYDSIVKVREQLKFNLLLDLGHLYVSSKTLGLDYNEECDKLNPYIRWIHVSDNNGITDEHRPLREESNIMKALKRISTPNINITLETVGDINEILSNIKMIED